MPRRPRRNHSAAFEAKVALEAIKGEEPIIEIAERFDVHPNVITKWKRQLLEGAAEVFGAGEGEKELIPCRSRTRRASSGLARERLLPTSGHERA